jgi:hypothetical protein
VQSVGTGGTTSAFSNCYSFTVQTATVNHAPTLMLTGTSGTSVTTNQAYSITVSAADADGNLSNVDVNWNDGTAVERKFVNGSQVSVTFSRSFSTAQTINWSANAYDTGNLPSNQLSSSFTVTAVAGCGDQRDQMIAEYVTFGVNLAPTCSSFTQSAHSVHFSFAELNASNPYSWAIIRFPLTVAESSGFGLDRWRANAGGTPRFVNSAYRAPAHNAAIGGASQSRHMFGDAVDLRNLSQTLAEYTLMSNAANNAGASFIEPLTGSCGLACIHADWRNR